MPIKPTNPANPAVTDVAVQRIAIDVPHNTRTLDGTLAPHEAAMGVTVLVTEFDADGKFIRHQDMQLVWEDIGAQTKALLKQLYTRIEDEAQERGVAPPGPKTPLPDGNQSPNN